MLDPNIFHLQSGEHELFVNPEIIPPEFIPETGNKDFSHGYDHPIVETFFTPAFTYRDWCKSP